MYNNRIKPPKRTDLPELIKDVPEDHKEYVKNLCKKMMQHPAYGQP